jgi:hypothetical protein
MNQLKLSQKLGKRAESADFKTARQTCNLAHVIVPFLWGHEAIEELQVIFVKKLGEYIMLHPCISELSGAKVEGV